MTDSITFNDQSQSLVQAGTVFQTQFAWASDVPTGTVLLGQSAQITSNSLDNRSFVSNHGKDHAQYDAPNNVVRGGGQIRINDQIMSTIAGDLVTTTASTATSINYAGQSQLIADGKLDVAATGQTGDYHLEERSRYRVQDTESIQSLWSNGAWTETGHNFTVDHEAHDAWIYNQTVNLPINSDPIITNNPDGSTSSQIIRLGQDQSTVTSGGGYDYHLTQSGSSTDFWFSLNHTSQSQSGKHDTGTWRAADGTSGATYDNLGSETKGSRANLSGRVQNGSVYYDGIDVYQTRNTSTNNTGSGFALGSTTNSHTVGSTQTTESRGGNSGSWYGSKLESGNSTTNYTTVSGTMGQPFSGMTQTGFNTTTMYGTAAQTGITGMYGSYGQTGSGGTTNGTLAVGNTITPPEPLDLPQDNTLTPDQLIDLDKFNSNDIYRPITKEERAKIRIRNINIRMAEAQIQNDFFLRNYRSPEEKQRDEILGYLNLDNIHTGLDIVGMAPIVGEIADGLNAAIYLVQGKYVEAGLSVAAMIPGLGIFSVSGRLGKKLLNLEEAVFAETKQIERLTELGLLTEANGAIKKAIIPVDATTQINQRFLSRNSCGSVPTLEGNVPQANKWIRTGGRVIYYADGSMTYIKNGIAIRYNSVGYPDFSKYLYKGGDGVSQVRINLNGSRHLDEIAANAEAGFKETSIGFIWHHHEAVGLMQLVDERVHRAFWHSGGFSIIK